MKLNLVLGVFFAAALMASGQVPGTTMVAATTTLHTNGTRTESVKDMFKHEIAETTFDARGIAITKKKFLLNENGDPTQGTIYDGADNVIARAQFIFDDLGRVVEERRTNTQNEMYQRVIRKYDSSGKPLPPEVFNYAVKAPNMSPSKMNFTQSPGPGPARSGTTQAGGNPSRLGAAPQIETASPGSINGNVQVVEPSQYAPVPVPQTESPKEESKKGSKLNPLNWFKKGK
jgi:hypothetical protein